MDNGPFRMPRSAPERGSGNRPSAAAKPNEERRAPEAPKEELQQVRHNYAPAPEPRSKKPLIAVIVGVIVVVLAALGVWLFWALSPQLGNATGIDSSKYQAVSFVDGQLYFGKLTRVDDEYLKLTDVFYLQPQTDENTETSDARDLQKSTVDQSNYKLMKFTDVLYGPEDEMIISKEHILFYENIKPDGKLAQLIEQYKNQN